LDRGASPLRDGEIFEADVTARCGELLWRCCGERLFNNLQPSGMVYMAERINV
jgi:hypothetical protein